MAGRRSRLGRCLVQAVLAALTAALCVLLPAGDVAAAVTPGGMISNSWSFSGAPAAGMTKVAFVLKVTSQPNAKGYYWAQQYYFQSGQVGYIGLQPRIGGGVAIFSVFGSGTTTSHPNCRTGADGSSGTSCSINYPYVTGRWYELEIIRTGTNTWTGYVVDASVSGGIWTTIGTWSVSASAGLLRPSGVGFVEYFTSVADCGAIPYARVVWNKPFTHSGEGNGTNTSAYTYGPCKANAGYALSNGQVTMTTGG